MCDVDSYEKYHPSEPENGSSGGGRPFPIESSKELLESLGHIINFINNWVQFFEDNYDDILI